MGQSPGVGVAGVYHADHRLLLGGGAGGDHSTWHPTIFNTDQGYQFTNQEFTGLLAHHGIQISMDGKGYWRDNVFVERLWKSLKYEEVFLRANKTVGAAQQGLECDLTFYNGWPATTQIRCPAII